MAAIEELVTAGTVLWRTARGRGDLGPETFRRVQCLNPINYCYLRGGNKGHSLQLWADCHAHLEQFLWRHRLGRFVNGSLVVGSIFILGSCFWLLGRVPVFLKEIVAAFDEYPAQVLAYFSGRIFMPAEWL